MKGATKEKKRERSMSNEVKDQEINLGAKLKPTQTNWKEVVTMTTKYDSPLKYPKYLYIYITNQPPCQLEDKNEVVSTRKAHSYSHSSYFLRLEAIEKIRNKASKLIMSLVVI